MASSVIKNAEGYRLLDSATFTGLTTVEHTVTVDVDKIREVAVLGGCISATFPMIPGRTFYDVTGYYYVSGAYNLRTYIGISIVNASTLSIRYRLESKGSSEGYPTINIYYR